ncbi:hypothetical protein [Paraburkholderia sp. EG304]|uniref:hypothetical protein n=1 Tax=Paraburkholderia sp. EG304 TaxID=3237015 RepID=UPI0039799B27
MIELERHPVKIQHINVRTELHGDEERTAVDIKLGFDVPNTSLEALAEGLRGALYEAPEDADLLGDAERPFTRVRFPQFGTFKWAGEWSSVGLHLHLGNGRGKGDLIFSEAVFGKLTVACKEGGSCACVVRVQLLPTPDETAKLVGLLKREVPATTDLSEAVDLDAPTGDDDHDDYEEE